MTRPRDRAGDEPHSPWGSPQVPSGEVPAYDTSSTRYWVVRHRPDDIDLGEAGDFDDEEPFIRTPDHSRTQNLLATIMTVGMTLMILLVVVGGLLGKFEAGIVTTAIGSYSAAFGAAAWFYFRKDKGEG